MTPTNGGPLLGDPTDGIDPYLPKNGNLGYRVSRYELDLEYKVASNRLAGVAIITATSLTRLTRFTLDLATSLTVSRVSVNGRRPARYSHRDNKIAITMTDALPPGAAMTITVKYGGSPRPIRGPWGEVGFEELTEGALCANQPNGAASWFPCDDHPSSKAPYLISITTDSPYVAIANGTLARKRTKAAQTTWVYEQVEPMATYLATLQIGPYVQKTLSSRPVRISAVLPERLSSNFAHDFGRQKQIMDEFCDMFGPYPFPAYTVVVTDDNLEIPIEAQGLSTFGANHCDGTRGSERLVAHELAHQWFGNSLTLSRWTDIWLHEGFACYSEWLWSERAGEETADALARRHHRALAAGRKDIIIGDPGPASMFDDRVYKRGALTLHALRLSVGDEAFFAMLRQWTRDYRYSSVSTADFTDLAARYSDTSLSALWQRWLRQKAVPEFPGD
nr:M1 family metallopeptidase [Williamsia sp. CHRR-6]